MDFLLGEITESWNEQLPGLKASRLHCDKSIRVGGDCRRKGGAEGQAQFLILGKGQTCPNRHLPFLPTQSQATASCGVCRALRCPHCTLAVQLLGVHRVSFTLQHFISVYKGSAEFSFQHRCGIIEIRKKKMKTKGTKLQSLKFSLYLKPALSGVGEFSSVSSSK